ncbi:NTE family protein [Jatrophihabitans sp. GAS493]|uniref:patatin-like phospholipase family protein n=1 Tax=Jatrophihabitans sp. GAS493 TaxID=1907575 RepID=UPI000BB813BC|nr:patatin-like phospholipase family protein [Jatrophihabitans sp. GAS493]SOD70288.1 NTE family protein [Jatrophihabitans sp. GAS493]
MNATPFSNQHNTSTTPADRSSSEQHQPEADSTSRTATAGERALVLGGGGSTGNAWLIGVIAGLSAAGLDVTEADLIIGTSAGSTAAAQISGASPNELLAAILDAASQPSTTAPGRDRRPPAMGPVVNQLQRLREIIDSAADVADLRRRLGAAASDRDATADGPRQLQWRATVAARLPSQDWPDRRMFITAIDADTGEPVVFDRHSGVELVDAIAASCSNGFGLPPYRIGDRRYLDGGYRSNAENADLALGYGRVLVLSPFGGRSLHPPAWGTHLATQIEELRAHGSRVETIFPDPDAEHMFGANAMDLSLRPAAARAGFEQGRARAELLAPFWR